MFSSFTSTLMRPFDTIIQAYYDGENVRTYRNKEVQKPSSEHLEKIEEDLEQKDTAGKFSMAFGVLGLGGAYVVRRVPYIGKPAAVVTTIMSLATIVFGWDIQTSAQNLSEFTYSLNRNSGEITINLKNMSPKEFKAKLLEVATKGTLTSAKIYHSINKDLQQEGQA